MYQVYQHWDQLKVCVVGRAYNPEQFAWNKNTKTRSYFEQLAIETDHKFWTNVGNQGEYIFVLC